VSAYPQLLPLNQVDHFYRGGQRISALRGASRPGTDRRPEEWIGSMTTMASDPGRGRSRLADGTLLYDAVTNDPESWLGAEHVKAYGPSTELLVKLLDAAQRLPVHLHPDRAFARRYLGLPHGKNEAWIVLDADAGAGVRLGFANTMRLADVRTLVDKQDNVALVESLRPLPIRPGDGVLVPAGVPHSIDAGVFVLELQEPSDLSILLEWTGFPIDGREYGHLGLGFDVALDALCLNALDDGELDSLVAQGERADLLPAAADPYFRADLVRAGNGMERGFVVALVTGGTGELRTESGDRLDLTRGDAAVVPYSAGGWWLDGSVEVIACRPPRPGAAS
jgi:mannose-6-phosphate isomerase